MNNSTESISEIAKLAKQASFELAQQNREKKDAALILISEDLIKHKEEIL